MRTVWNFFYRIGIHDIFGLLAFVGLIYFLIKRFILHQAPVPSSAFKTVPKELLEECVGLLKRKEKRTYETYTVPEDILERLKTDLHDAENLKRLLLSICAHLGINGEFIKLVVQDTPVPDRAGEIATDLAFTTIRLELKSYYIPETVIAVLAHESIHLHLYYEGIRLKDTWENEILTDTAAVYCGFGEYLYKGYAVMRGEFALSYQKVGYIKQEDVQFIQKIMQEEFYENRNGI